MWMVIQIMTLFSEVFVHPDSYYFVGHIYFYPEVNYFTVSGYIYDEMINLCMMPT